MTILTVEGSSTDVQINMDLARAYLDALGALSEKTGLKNDMTLSPLRALPISSPSARARRTRS